MTSVGICAQCALPSIQVKPVLPDHRVVLNQQEAMKLVKPCSRRGVTGVQSAWIPSSTDISKMEPELVKYLTKHQPKIAKKLDKIYFQYVGYVVNGKPIIYINAFTDFLFADLDITERDYWKTTAVRICDGGRDLWGIEYDPQTNHFSNIAFNGNA